MIEIINQNWHAIATGLVLFSAAVAFFVGFGGGKR